MIITINELNNNVWETYVEGGGTGSGGEYSFHRMYLIKDCNYTEALQAAINYKGDGDDVRVNVSLDNFRYF